MRFILTHEALRLTALHSSTCNNRNVTTGRRECACRPTLGICWCNCTCGLTVLASQLKQQKSIVVHPHYISSRIKKALFYNQQVAIITHSNHAVAAASVIAQRYPNKTVRILQESPEQNIRMWNDGQIDILVCDQHFMLCGMHLRGANTNSELTVYFLVLSYPKLVNIQEVKQVVARFATIDQTKKICIYNFPSVAAQNFDKPAVGKTLDDRMRETICGNLPIIDLHFSYYPHPLIENCGPDPDLNLASS